MEGAVGLAAAGLSGSSSAAIMEVQPPAVAPFARSLASDPFSIAMQAWAVEKGCEEIDMENTDEFFRVWLGCALFACCFSLLVAVPYCFCTNRPDPDFDHEKDRLPDHVVRDPADLGEEVFTPRDIDPTPDLTKAREHLVRTSPTTFEGKWRGVWRTKVGDLSEVGGIGTELYFRMLRSLGLCFSYLSILSMPIVIFSYSGNFVPDIGSTPAKTAVGNLGMVAMGGITQAERLIIVGCQGVSITKFTRIFAWLDFIGIFVFTIFIIWFRFRFLPRTAKKDDQDTISMSDFTLEIEGLPRRISDHANYEQVLHEFLLDRIRNARRHDKYHSTSVEPKINEIVLVRDFNQRLETLREHAQMKRQLEIATDKNETPMTRTRPCGKKVPLSTVVEEKERQLSEKVGAVVELPVLRAFVVVNSPDDKQRLLVWYRFANFRLFRLCQHRQNRFQGGAIHMCRAPEPSNIIWENQDVPWSKRLCMRSIMVSLWVLVMAISLVLIYLTSWAASKQGTQANAQTLNEGACDAGTQTDGYVCNGIEAATWTKVYAATLSGDARACYCTTIGSSNILSDKELWDGLCKDWLVDASIQIMLGVFASIIVVIINSFLQQLIYRVAAWEKPLSMSALNSSIVFKVAVSQFFNTSVIIFLINYNGFLIFDGDYGDFERGWYAMVGASIVINMFLNAFSGAITNLIFWFWAAAYRFRCCTRKIKHQAELLEVYTNPPFDIASRYAQILTTCFCTLTYSAGLPVLNVFAALYFFISFWTDKYLLLRGSHRPPAYDTQMPKEAAELLLYAGPLHMLVAVFTYSHTCTFPSDPVGGALASLASQGTTLAASHIDNASNTIADRISKESTWMFFVLFVIILALWVLWVLLGILGATVGACWQACKTVCCPRRRRTVPDEMEDLTFEKCHEYIHKTRPPASYAMRRHHEYKDLNSTLERFGSPPASPSGEVPALPTGPGGPGGPASPGEDGEGP